MEYYSTNNKDFENIYRTYYKKMFGICVNYVHNQVIAEDLLQDAFIVVINKLPTLKDKTKLEPWISTIVKNTCINYLRKKSLFSNISVDIAEHNEETEGKTDQESDAISYSTLMNMVEKLPEGYKKVFKLAVLEGYSHEEIAKLLEISPKTSSSQLSRAKKTLKSMIYSYWTLAIVSIILFIFILDRSFLTTPLNDNGILRENNFAKTLKREITTNKQNINTNRINKIYDNLTEEREKSEEILAEDTNVLLSSVTDEETREYFEEEKIDILTGKPFNKDILYYDKNRQTVSNGAIGLNFSFDVANYEFSNYISTNNENSITDFINPVGSDIEKKYHKPMSLSIMFEKAFWEHFSLGIGFVYTFLKTECLADNKRFLTFNLQYLGFKSQLSYHYYKNKNIDFYTSISGIAELPVYHRTKIYLSNETISENLNANCQFYSGASLGFSFHLGYGINVFAEPSLNYYFENKDEFETFRNKHRWDFNIPIGIKIKL